MNGLYVDNGMAMNDYVSDSGYSPRRTFSPVPTSPRYDSDLSPRRLMGLQSASSNRLMMPLPCSPGLTHSSESPRLQRSLSSMAASSGLSSGLEMGSTFQHSTMYKRKEKSGQRAGVMSSAKNTLWQSSDVDSYIGHIKEMSKDHNGCRALQQCLDDCPQKMVSIIYEEVGNDLTELMMDSFGNYLFQKLLDVSSSEQRREVVSVGEVPHL